MSLPFFGDGTTRASPIMPLSDEQLSVQAMRAELKAERLVKRKELELLLSVS